MVRVRQEMYMEHQWESVVEISNGDVTSGSERLLGVEVDKPPLMTNEKTQHETHVGHL
jgi:hypothetical protein